MSTILISILVIVLVVLAACAVLLPYLRGRGGRGGNLRRRFGPEYERTLARHDGDRNAAEGELKERLHRYGDLRTRALEPAARDTYAGKWQVVQESFVESPQRAIDEADLLLGRLTRDRGYPDDAYDEQVAALSVHLPGQVSGYRSVHAAATRAREGRAETEELRAALLEGRGLFDALTAERPEDREAAGDGHGPDPERTGHTGTERTGTGHTRTGHTSTTRTGGLTERARDLVQRLNRPRSDRAAAASREDGGAEERPRESRAERRHGPAKGAAS